MSDASVAGNPQRAACVTAVLLAGAFSAASVLAQQDFSGVQIQTEQIAENLYVLIGAGGNIGVSVGVDGAMLIDDQYAPLSDKILSAVDAVSELPVQFVINTHWHGDHTGGNENMRRAGAIILAHDNVRRRMSIEVDLPLFDSRTAAAPLAARPVITYPDAVELHWNGETIRVVHVEHAHTDGDSIVHFVDSNVVHMGDTLWTSGYPRVDVGTGGGSVQGVIDAVESISAVAGADTQLIPGHGALPPLGTAFLAEYTSMLETIQERVRDAIASGMTEDQVVGAAPTQDYDARWGQGYMNPETFTRVVYRSLTR